MDNIAFYNCLCNDIVNYSFDFICSFETIEHMDEESGDLFLLKILKSLKPKGRLLISTPINKSKIKTNLTPYHIREYDDIEFKQKLIKTALRLYRCSVKGIVNIITNFMVKISLIFLCLIS
jgi:cyclopropane fatty-acyl-phospholipid synthase-like methyltransferase